MEMLDVALLRLRFPYHRFLATTHDSATRKGWLWVVGLSGVLFGGESRGGLPSGSCAWVLNDSYSVRLTTVILAG